MSGPSDATGNSGQVSHNRRVVLVLLILILDLIDLEAVVMEEDSVFGVHTVSQVVALENGLELSEELQRIFDACDNLEVFVNVPLEFGFNV